MNLSSSSLEVSLLSRFNPPHHKSNTDMQPHLEGAGGFHYLKESSIHRENGRVVYDINRSKILPLSIQIGVQVAF